MMKRLSEQVRELPCDSPGTGSSYRAGWDSALEKVAQLVEANQTTRVVCGYCDTPIDDTPEAFAEHDAACERNPLAARAQELEAIERHLRGLLAGVQSDLRDLESTNEALAKRVAELEAVIRHKLQDLDALTDALQGAESQLAWTPVAQGLPTADGDTTFRIVACDGQGGAMLLEPRLSYQDNEWKWCTPEFPFGVRFGENCPWVFRRITLPEAT